ncbi:hypothetical protein KA082_01540 [Candidatus Woesebacteria bacterium]|nr:hypothetical protein [Candidatus Woesebacteria bacterium]
MSENSVHSKTERKQFSGVKRRNFIQAMLAMGFAATAFGVEIPTKQQVESAYTLLARVRAEELQKYVDPVESYPVGDWSLASFTEKEIKLYKNRDNFGIPTEVILEDAGIVTGTIGDYVFSNKDKKSLHVHLGLHGQHGKGMVKENSRYPVLISEPEQVGAISVDSIHSFLSWQDISNLNLSENQAPTPIQLDQVDPKIIQEIEQDLSSHLEDWIRNLDDETVILATDIPMNKTVVWSMFFQLSAHPSASHVFDDLGPLKQSAEWLSAVTAAATTGDLIQNLFKQKISRRELLKNIWRGIKISAASVAVVKSIQPVTDFYNSHVNVLQNIDCHLVNSRVNAKVKVREPKHFLGRVEDLIEKDPSEVDIYEVYMTLRDLTSSYKELSIMKNGAYSKEGRTDFMSVWGLFHDTKLGLLSTTCEYVLNLISRFNKRFEATVDRCFMLDQKDPAWQINVNRSSLWTAMGYKTKMTETGRKIEAADIWYFSELEEIFQK